MLFFLTLDMLSRLKGIETGLTFQLRGGTGATFRYAFPFEGN